MAGRLGPIQIDCDAPPYAVVQACERLGFESPSDVRWCRMSHLLNGRVQPGGALALPFWKRLFRRHRPEERACACGRPLPALAKYSLRRRPEAREPGLLFASFSGPDQGGAIEAVGAALKHFAGPRSEERGFVLGRRGRFALHHDR
jgi:hypothetical protein